MSDAQVQTGGTEIIEILAIDVYGAALTGLTDLKIDIRRKSDGKLLDFNDSTFKSSGWTTRQQVLTETDAVNEAGWYRYTWTIPATADIYTVTYRQTSLTTCANVPAFGTLRAGGFVDTIANNLNAPVATATGTAQAGAASSITLAAGASSTDNLYRFLLITITGGTGAGQTRLILAYTGSTKVAVVNRQWQTTPDNTSTYALSPASAPGLVTSGFAQAGAASTITLASFSSSNDDTYVGETVWISGGTGFGQERVITAYNGTTKVATVDRAWTTNPDSTSTYEVYPFGRVVVTSNLDKSGYTASVGSGGITSSSFAAGAIDAASIAADAITAAKIAAGAITSSEAPALANLDAAVSSRAVAGDAMTLADNAITAAKLATGAITAAKFAAGAIDAAAIATDAIDADALKADAVAEIQNGLAMAAGVMAATAPLATSAALTTAQGDLTAIKGAGFTAGVDDLHSARTAVAAVNADTDDIQTRLPAALVNGRMDSSVGAMAADTLTSSALAASAVAEVQAGLATTTNVSDAQGAINAHTDSATSGLAQQATLSAGIAAILSDVDSVPAATSAAVTSAHGAGSYVALTPPTAAAISAQVAADLATAHGAGSWATASVAGLATGQNVLDAVSAIEAYGQLHWITATGFAVAGDAMTLTGGERTAIAAAVWATAEGGTEGDLRFAISLLRRRQTERREMDALGVERFYNGNVVEKKVVYTDVNGDPVGPAAGEPARATAEQDP